MSDAPQTLWETSEQVLAGMRFAVSAARFMVGQPPAARGAVTATLAVPNGFFGARSDGGMAATILMNASEARDLARCLEQAADAADGAGPPLYAP